MLIRNKCMIRMLLLLIVVVGVASCKKEDEPAAVSHEQENVPEKISGNQEEIHFKLVNDETIEISGHGELREIDDQYWYEDGEKSEYQIRTLIVKEGITKLALAGTRMEYVQEVFLPDSLEEIGDQCFWGFDDLRQVSFGNGLKKIGKSAFQECQYLEQALLPASVVEIGAYAFEDDNRLGFFIDRIEPGRKKAAVFALWFPTYTVESRKKGEVTITVDTTGSYSGYEGFDIRYSANKDMSHALYLPKGIIEQGSRTVKDLKSGETYYFQRGGWGDAEWIEEFDNSINDQDWMGKRKVVVK